MTVFKTKSLFTEAQHVMKLKYYDTLENRGVNADAIWKFMPVFQINNLFTQEQQDIKVDRCFN